MPAADLQGRDIRLVPTGFGANTLSPEMRAELLAIVHQNAHSQPLRLVTVPTGPGDYDVADESDQNSWMPDYFLTLDRPSMCEALREVFSTHAHISQAFIVVPSFSMRLLRQLQMALLAFGIKARIERIEEYADARRAYAFEGDDEFDQNYRPWQPLYLLIDRPYFPRFERELGFTPGTANHSRLQEYAKFSNINEPPLVDRVIRSQYVGERPVYDLTEPVTHHFVANGICVHNCSEYMFLDDTACNLASLNLLKFYDDRTAHFDVESFRHATRLWTLILEISVVMAQFPSKAVAQKSFDFRTLGLGYANMGSVLMVQGIPYDSPEGGPSAGPSRR